MGQTYRFFLWIFAFVLLASTSSYSRPNDVRRDFQMGLEARLTDLEKRVLQMQREVEIRPELKESEIAKRVDALHAKCTDTRKLLAATTSISDSKWSQFSADLQLELEELESRLARLHQALNTNSQH